MCNSYHICKRREQREEKDRGDTAPPVPRAGGMQDGLPSAVARGGGGGRLLAFVRDSPPK